MSDYYISGTGFTIRERETRKNGLVYDVAFRVIDKTTGMERQKKLSGFVTKKAAKEAYTDFVTKHCELMNGRIRREKDPVTDTVGSVFAQYLAALTNQAKASSVCDKRDKFRLFILPAFEQVRVKDITPEMLYDWQDKLWSIRSEKTGEFYAFNYLKSIRNTFSAFLSWYSSRTGVPNPFSAVKMPKRRSAPTEMSIWTEEEFGRFLAVVDDPMYRAVFAVLFYTGRRRGEVLALSPDDVRKDSIHFTKTVSTRLLVGKGYSVTSTKNEKKGKTAIGPSLRKILDEYTPEPGAKFFFGGADPIPAETLRRRFHQYGDEAGLPRIRIHDLRHSFVSLVIHKGASLPVVADLIGDTQEQVTRTYSHMYDEDRTRILSSL